MMNRRDMFKRIGGAVSAVVLAPAVAAPVDRFDFGPDDIHRMDLYRSAGERDVCEFELHGTVPPIGSRVRIFLPGQPGELGEPFTGRVKYIHVDPQPYGGGSARVGITAHGDVERPPIRW